MAKIILLNKPFNVLCQFSDKQGRDTLGSYITDKGVYPAGRLDYDSEGLLILTDDGRLQHQISHPVKKMPKTYWVQVEGSPSDAELQPLRNGLHLKDGSCRPAIARLMVEPEIWPRTPPVRFRQNIPTSWLEITITEGRNRQVRRMTAAIGYPTLRLIRMNIGQWSINNLGPGESITRTVNATKQAETRPKLTPRRIRRL